jgi:hypothetical protein
MNWPFRNAGTAEVADLSDKIMRDVKGIRSFQPARGIAHNRLRLTHLSGYRRVRRKAYGRQVGKVRLSARQEYRQGTNIACQGRIEVGSGRIEHRLASHAALR